MVNNPVNMSDNYDDLPLADLQAMLTQQHENTEELKTQVRELIEERPLLKEGKRTTMDSFCELLANTENATEHANLLASLHESVVQTAKRLTGSNVHQTTQATTQNILELSKKLDGAVMPEVQQAKDVLITRESRNMQHIQQAVETKADSNRKITEYFEKAAACSPYRTQVTPSGAPPPVSPTASCTSQDPRVRALLIAPPFTTIAPGLRIPPQVVMALSAKPQQERTAAVMSAFDRLPLPYREKLIQSIEEQRRGGLKRNSDHAFTGGASPNSVTPSSSPSTIQSPSGGRNAFPGLHGGSMDVSRKRQALAAPSGLPSPFRQGRPLTPAPVYQPQFQTMDSPTQRRNDPSYQQSFPPQIFSTTQQQDSQRKQQDSPH